MVKRASSGSPRLKGGDVVSPVVKRRRGEEAASPAREDEGDEGSCYAAAAGRLAEALCAPAGESCSSADTPSTVDVDAQIWAALHPRLAASVRAAGVRSFFAIQRAVLPTALRHARPELRDQGRDVCVAAPTGSGKTLVYVLAVCESLVRRRVPRLRAVVVVPSRELARQVACEFARLAPRGTAAEEPLRVALAVGRGTGEGLWADEQRAGRPLSAAAAETAARSVAALEALEDGRPDCCDCLVCTPGRLVEHIAHTPGFTLKHVRYVVADEADRLLAQRFHGWATTLASRLPKSTRKLLFSATLGDDPRPLAALRLARPLYFFVKRDSDGERCEQTEDASEVTGSAASLPTALAESTALCDAESKPLALLALLDREKDPTAAPTADAQTAQLMLAYLQVVAFASSVDTVSRLATLLRLWFAQTAGCHVLELSSAQSASKRDAVLRACRERCARSSSSPASVALVVLVCSDALARGIDLADVALVVNYDAPTSAKAYVHRVGRCARAGRAGRAVTLVKRGQERAFDRLRAEIDATQLARLKLPLAELRALVPAYQACLASLKDQLQGRGKTQA